MKSLKILVPVGLSCFTIFTACNGNQKSNDTKKADQNTISINPKEMKHIGSVDERYQSYNIEMAEIAGGSFWKPYRLMDSLPDLSTTATHDVSQKKDDLYRKLAPINLTDTRLLNLAKGLAPAYVRVSGTWANAIYFQDNDEPQMKNPPKGFVNVVTKNQWKSVIDFVKATDSKLVTSFAVSNGVRDANGVWTPIEAQKIADYTKNNGGEIAAAELFNEPSIPSAGGEINKNYDAQNFAKDVAVFNSWAKTTLPNMLILGPGSVGEGLPLDSFEGMEASGISTDEMMSANPKPQFDVFSYHFYGAASMRIVRSGSFSIKAKNALDQAWLQKTDTGTKYYAGLRDKYMPGKPLWITETAQAGGGGDPYAATYLDTFRYLYQLGSSAKNGVKVIMHNTLAASEYSLIDQDTHLPKPNYWVALLWAKLMGTEVYEAGNGVKGVYLFAHNQKNKKDSITLLVLNTNEIPANINIPLNAEQYTITSTELEGKMVKLNGSDLKLDANDNLPAIKGKSVKAGNIELPPFSSSFITFANTGNSNQK